eukprot:m.187142 g.187142  ORF g.187142 m.187142 type:complete len:122 (-) comp13623_c1_seq9:1242-1607(-)
MKVQPTIAYVQCSKLNYCCLKCCSKDAWITNDSHCSFGLTASSAMCETYFLKAAQSDVIHTREEVVFCLIVQTTREQECQVVVVSKGMCSDHLEYRQTPNNKDKIDAHQLSKIKEKHDEIL